MIQEEDTGTVKFLKKMAEFNTSFHPFFIMFAINFVTGSNYAFDMCLFFFVLLCLVLFNLVSIHKKCVEHKVFLAILENLWMVLSFFWFVNVWASGRWQQPYYKV